MATIENNGLMVYKDKDGNNYVLYPITKAELVDGLEELLAAKANTTTMTELLAKKADLTHAARHAAGGADPITPQAIGAALANLSNVPAASIQEAISAAGGAKIATGRYTGTGTYGVNNPNSLTFDFVPKWVFIIKAAGTSTTTQNISIPVMCLTSEFKDYTYGTNDFESGRYSFAKIVGNTVSWYSGGNSSSASNQANVSGVQYHYLAIG